MTPYNRHELWVYQINNDSQSKKQLPKLFDLSSIFIVGLRLSIYFSKNIYYKESKESRETSFKLNKKDKTRLVHKLWCWTPVRPPVWKFLVEVPCNDKKYCSKCFVGPYKALNIFRGKILFERKTFISVVYFSFSWKCPWRAEFNSAELVSCIIQVSGVITLQKPEVVGSNPVVDQIFHVFSDTR